MRVISGVAGGLKLFAPAGRETRPTSDRVKEALFSILESCNAISEAKVLDIFSGSGALAIEALSRGASEVTMIDRSRQATEAVKKNLLKTGFNGQATVICADYLHSLERLARSGNQFDLVIIDPPYSDGIHLRAMELASPLLKPDGLLVAEASSRMPLPVRTSRLYRSDRRIYGDTSLEFFLLEDNNAP